MTFKAGWYLSERICTSIGRSKYDAGRELKAGARGELRVGGRGRGGAAGVRKVARNKCIPGATVCRSSGPRRHERAAASSLPRLTTPLSKYLCTRPWPPNITAERISLTSSLHPPFVLTTRALTFLFVPVERNPRWILCCVCCWLTYETFYILFSVGGDVTKSSPACNFMQMLVEWRLSRSEMCDNFMCKGFIRIFEFVGGGRPPPPFACNQRITLSFCLMFVHN